MSFRGKDIKVSITFKEIEEITVAQKTPPISGKYNLDLEGVNKESYRDFIKYLQLLERKLN